MFDPTVYENLKVVLEGAVYDLDLAGMIHVSNRVDRIDLSTMSRFYSIQFREAESLASEGTAEICLSATMQDLAAEIIDEDSTAAGCLLTIHFTRKMMDVERECLKIQQILGKIWEGRPEISQEISFQYGVTPTLYTNRITLNFGRTINETQIEDMPDLIDHTFFSLQQLNQM
ncbi:hypothetical protein [Ammoniphilus resinae]|uniref:Uncharacterized protein n=1 Tax=Ammoniphilus resinae TaxID=861532 RepID=A0ABS4GIW5_9BACL|nr:hypothetical protein [Ammoniphilus resinae]MBP1930169.1 hypothetical protein [Ammoniphilus resinae]